MRACRETVERLATQKTETETRAETETERTPYRKREKRKTLRFPLASLAALRAVWTSCPVGRDAKNGTVCPMEMSVAWALEEEPSPTVSP